LLLLLDFDEELDMVGLPSLPPSLPPCLKGFYLAYATGERMRGQIEYQTQQQQHNEEDVDDDVINGLHST